MRHLLPIIMSLLALVGCYDSHKEPSSGEFVDISNCNIVQLKQLCENGCYTITSNLVFVGRVTTSDREGNFYRSMVVEGTSGGMEILLGIYDIASQYPIGLMVAIELKGTAIMLKNGTLQVGLPPQSFDSAPREFESQAVIDSHIKRSNSVENIEPLRCDIASLDVSLCGQFVNITNLRHTPLDEYNESNYRRFEDENGNAIFMYISQYADFSDIEIPASKISIRGILYHEAVGGSVGEQFIVRPRSKDDISTSNDTF